MVDAQQKIKAMIVAKAIEFGSDADAVINGEPDAAYDHLVEHDEHWDAMNEVREGEVETGIPCEWSRHYESKSVAARAPDGSWVGWTYWYGGGKHGAPEEVDWVEGAYDLVVTEEEKMVTVRTFAKTPVPA